MNLLLDVEIRCPSDNSNFPDDAWIFLEVFVDGDQVKRTERFAKEPMGESWRLEESIKMSVIIKPSYIRFSEVRVLSRMSIFNL